LPCSNPLAGTDTTLLALSGAGYADSKCFGFASCERRAGAAEGVNVLMERRTKRADGKVRDMQPCNVAHDWIVTEFTLDMRFPPPVLAHTCGLDLT
jgi:hypothetical protein